MHQVLSREFLMVTSLYMKFPQWYPLQSPGQLTHMTCVAPSTLITCLPLYLHCKVTCNGHQSHIKPHTALNPKVNTLRPRQNGRHISDDIFKCIFWNENNYISIKISLKFVPKGPINNIPSLVQIMAWRRPGDKPLSEPMMVSLSTHICITRPQWVNP